MSTTPGPNNQELHPREAERLERVAAFPFVAVFLQATGIHPSTGRLTTIDALTFDDGGQVGEEFHAVLRSDVDAGPRHQHGLSDEELEQGRSFTSVLKSLDRLLDGRTLIVHDATFTWGFLVSEARRAMTSAARANRNRGRGRNRRRRHKVGHVPTPVAIIDTLATARRQAIALDDLRIAAVATAYGLKAPDYKASVERATQPEAEYSRTRTRLLIDLAAEGKRREDAGEGGIAKLDPEDLTADRFGLQRSQVRVDAAEAPRRHSNPGKWKPGGKLQQGMEFVVAPEVCRDPDELIAKGVAAGLNYVEKLSRESSLVVCNLNPHGVEGEDLKGKAMHAHRKDIPLVSDEEFLELLDDVDEAAPEAPEPKREQRAHVPNANNRSTRRRTRRPSGAAGKPNGRGHKAGGNGAAGGGTGAGSGSGGSANGSGANKADKRSGKPREGGEGSHQGQRKRRRGSRGGNRRRRGGKPRQSGQGQA